MNSQPGVRYFLETRLAAAETRIRDVSKRQIYFNATIFPPSAVLPGQLAFLTLDKNGNFDTKNNRSGRLVNKAIDYGTTFG